MLVYESVKIVNTEHSALSSNITKTQWNHFKNKHKVQNHTAIMVGGLVQ